MQRFAGKRKRVVAECTVPAGCTACPTAANGPSRETAGREAGRVRLPARADAGPIAPVGPVRAAEEPEVYD
ncbi:Penicillin-binding protein, 1A family [Methylobacterium sp. ME121]|nr:Penicillin-binding protein, 1A family [Methylobacterium sp. ME121]